MSWVLEAHDSLFPDTHRDRKSLPHDSPHEVIEAVTLGFLLLWGR